MLYKGLPPESLSKRESDEEGLWGPTEELLAQIVEEVSVLAADRRRDQPRSVPRPGEQRRVAKPGVVKTESGGMVATGIAGMLAASQMRGAVNI